MEKIYFIGINGIGMSGLAKIMKLKNYDVSGADISRNYVTEELEKLGIKVYSEHDGENIKDTDLIIASSAIKEDNPELMMAKKLNKKIIKRGELLALLMNREKGIAVAGTHGKTTTSSMLGSVLLEIDPTIVIGGILPEIGSNSHAGKNEIFIAEADESDNSFLHLNPTISVITNIEADHLENHGSLENIKRSFNQFMNQTKDEIIICKDCKETVELTKGRENIITYSIYEKADVIAKNIRVENFKTVFNVEIKGENIGEFRLTIPGNHNIQNSLPVIYIANKLGISTENIRKRLENFKGAKRRYDILYNIDGVRVIDDYAHHPTEIKATLQGAKSIEENGVMAIFQPHRYSRVNFLINEFEGCFEEAEEVILLPIYSAGERNIYNVSLELLKEKIKHKNCKIVNSEKELENIILERKNKITYMFMGAGSISYLAHKIADEIGR